VVKETHVSDLVGVWWMRHQVLDVVGQQDHVLLHSAMPVGVSEGGTNGGGNRGGIGRSGSHVCRQDQPVNRVGNVDYATSHHRVYVPGVAVDGDRVGHEGSMRVGGVSGADSVAHSR
jgi:hypothetical protein